MRDANSHGPGEPVEPAGPRTSSPEPDRPEPLPPLSSSPNDAPGEPASVHVIVEADRTRIVLSGEVDADLAAELRDATADAEATRLPIEVDAHHVTFMDSSGIAFLARIATRSAQRVRVIRAPDNVRFLLDVTRIGELLDVVDPETGDVVRPATSAPATNAPAAGAPVGTPVAQAPSIAETPPVGGPTVGV